MDKGGSWIACGSGLPGFAAVWMETEFTSSGFVRLPKPCTQGVTWSVESSTYDPDSSPRAPGSAGPVEPGGSACRWSGFFVSAGARERTHRV